MKADMDCVGSGRSICFLGALNVEMIRRLVQRRRGAWVAARKGRYLSSLKATFTVDTDLEPTADQPQAIDAASEYLRGNNFTLLKGATGTGKTFVMAHTIARTKKPTLILSHNKTLAAQLARELRSFLPNSAVELFISYYDSFQPEAYNPKSGTYIAKLATVNKEIDALRHRATKALVEREDVVIVASVSCIYGLGLPKEYLQSVKHFEVGQVITMEEIVAQVQELMYEMVRTPLDLKQACFYSTGSDEISVWPPYLSAPIRIALEHGTIRSILALDTREFHGNTQLAFPDAGNVSTNDKKLVLYPARHHVTPESRREEAATRIRAEMEHRVEELIQEGQGDAAERLRTRTTEDMKMLEELGFCAGVENYSRHLALRDEGDPPDTLITFYNEAFGAKKWLLIVDESHVALPQLCAMYRGDRKRKETLVRHGFRLPSALDNRPLKESEFWDMIESAMFVSATPSKKELAMSKHSIVEMAIRPTGVMDPKIEIAKTENQLEQVVREIGDRAERDERTLVMAITKRDAEDLAEYLQSRGVKAAYLHSGLKIVQRSEVISRLQRADIDCIVGVNLLREGIDLPEVSLVCIMDADKQGFLRSKSSLLQMVGRAARHVNGTAVFFADKTSPAMRECMAETDVRRAKQLRYLVENDLQPTSARGREVASIFEMEKENRTDGEVDGMDWEAVSRALEEHKQRKRASKDDNLSSNGNAKDGDEEKSLPRYMPAHVASLKQQIKSLPVKTGVYMWKSGSDEDAEILYIGKAKNLRSRVSSYLRETAVTTRGTRLAAMLNRARTIDVVVTPGGERDALLLESDLIKKHRPLYNVLLRDSRYYPFIVITEKTDKQLPKLMTSVRSDLEGARYFGPFTSPAALRRVIELLEAALNLRHLRFQLRFGGESVEGEYLEAVAMATRILEGDTLSVARELFELGREQSARIVLAINNRSVDEDENARSWKRVQENAKAARELSQLFDIPKIPRRIEAFDISHFYGQYTVASRVVFLDGEPARHLYRSYKLEQVNDDFSSINKAVSKRLKSKEQLPDLMIIDGGKGQLSAAVNAIKDVGSVDELRVCAIAKQEEEIVVPGQLKSLDTNIESAAMLLVRHVRDESHRHAISKMRNARRDVFLEDANLSAQSKQSVED
ncbi:hypothetical protein NDN08_003753 [Rhodosorus marinus]|uniref:Excinuclease ABC subunit B n=1 Tax=Rhodosorus marinus TaxID=101924 RepID=A0AAV8UGE5_9RHOD|nr:hypothetical protein NDN08_003753 [Rhodosorus marinus]